MDLHRIFFGLPDSLGVGEVVFRTVVMFVLAALSFRVVGRRSVAQMNASDLIAVIALGGAIGDPMFNPDVPVRNAGAVIVVLVSLHLLLARAKVRSRWIEGQLEQSVVPIVKDGALMVNQLFRIGIASDEVFARLRAAGVDNLGRIELAFLESNGEITFLEAQTPKEGLSLFPPPDDEFDPDQAPGAAVPESGRYCCVVCGQSAILESGAPFPDCPGGCRGISYRRAAWPANLTAMKSSVEKHPG